jgi:hypothetical protein
MMEMVPDSAKAENQITMTGLNAHATRSVPRRWKSPMVMMAAMQKKFNPA